MSARSVNICNVNRTHLALIYIDIYIGLGKECLMGFGIYVSGWMQNLQEKAAAWDNWDELVDRGWLLTTRMRIFLFLHIC